MNTAGLLVNYCRRLCIKLPVRRPVYLVEMERGEVRKASRGYRRTMDQFLAIDGFFLINSGPTTFERVITPHPVWCPEKLGNIDRLDGMNAAKRLIGGWGLSPAYMVNWRAILADGRSMDISRELKAW